MIDVFSVSVLKIKQDIIRSILSMNISTVQQLNQMVIFVVFSNKIKAETTKKIQVRSRSEYK